MPMCCQVHYHHGKTAIKLGHSKFSIFVLWDDQFCRPARVIRLIASHTFEFLNNISFCMLQKRTVAPELQHYLLFRLKSLLNAGYLLNLLWYGKNQGNKVALFLNTLFSHQSLELMVLEEMKKFRPLFFAVQKSLSQWGQVRSYQLSRTTTRVLEESSQRVPYAVVANKLPILSHYSRQNGNIFTPLHRLYNESLQSMPLKWVTTYGFITALGYHHRFFVTSSQSPSSSSSNSSSWWFPRFVWGSMDMSIGR